MNIMVIPKIIQEILNRESFSVIPNRPTAVVLISIIGPTKAKELFTTNAFSISLSFSMRIAAKISIANEASSLLGLLFQWQ